MKRIATLAILAFVLVGGLLSAQNLAGNSYYTRTLELQQLAARAFDEGDYDAAAAYAAQAREYAQLSDEYVELMVAMTRADRALSAARLAVTEAAKVQADWLEPAKYNEAAAALAAAEDAYGLDAFPKAAEEAERATTLANAARQASEASAKAALAEARSSVATADGAGAAVLAPELFGDAKTWLAAAERATELRRFADARDNAVKATEAADEALKLSRSQAESAIAAARERLKLADAVNAKVNWAAEYGKATDELAAADASFSGSRYAEAKAHADAALAALAGLPATLPFPATYKVRLIPERRDCLWRIAEYPFIYNDPLKWTIIYEANKKTFRDPNNPNLIFPGQVLKIPSIQGETREGAFDPSKVYLELPKAKK